MSDFTGGFWSPYIAIVTIVSIAACAWLLFALSKRKVSGDPDKTGHVWDEDLDEYNNPLPRWWIWLFVTTIAFSVVYLWFYPGLGSFEGAWKWTSANEYQQEVQLAERSVAPMFERFAKVDLKTLAGDPAARQMGQKLFMSYCAQCHASDARGGRGFPNLTDEIWIYGGDPEMIEKTILDGRNGIMPPLGASLGPEKTKDVANYVRSLSGLKHDEARAARGKETFTTICAACHGADGKGNPAIGSANLTDKDWEYGSSEEAIIETITKGRIATMPPHREFLGEQRVRILAAYVYGLSHPESRSNDVIPVAATKK